LPQQRPQRYTFDRITIDLSRAALLRDGAQVGLRPRSFDALCYLVENRGRLVTKEELVQVLWPRTVVTDDSLVKCIQDVRNALDDDGHRYVKTVPRRGYIFDAKVTAELTGPAIEAPAADAVEPVVTAASPSVALAAAPPLARTGGTRSAVLVGGIAVAAVVAVGAWYFLSRSPEPTATATIPRSVAVLPFTNFNPSDENDFFANGVHESLLNELAKIQGVKTIARTSVLRYAQSVQPVHEIARELNVQSVVEGSVQYADGRVRVVAQLIDPTDDTHLWSESYDRPFADILSIQTEIARQIAGALDVELSVAEQLRLATAATRSPEAYMLYLRGRYHWDKWTSQEASKSIEYYTEATRLDPDYALAYAGIADAYTALHGLGVGSPAELMPKAKAAVERALEIDPQLPEAYIARGLIRHFYDWDYKGGNADFERAIALSPNSATAHHLYGKNLPVTLEFEKAFAELEHAMRLEPFSNGINKDLGETFYYARRYTEAVAQFERTLELEPESPPSLMWLARSYEALGRYDESVAIGARRLLPASPRSDGGPLSLETVRELEEIYRQSGWHAYWRRRLELMDASAAVQYVEPYRYVEVYTRLGDLDAAFEWLDKAFEQRSSWIPTVHFDPILDPLRSDPRYDELVRRAGLPTAPPAR
jgi:TolB-like protein/DNA-binding winged helix-turn-helix (wHTH) protein/Tfp pilus assembly protein PilF